MTDSFFHHVDNYCAALQCSDPEEMNILCSTKSLLYL